MKTLVIHPNDPTTDFLSVIYRGSGYKVIRHRMTDNELLREVKSHQRIIMLGHGSPKGLIGYSHIFTEYEFVKVLQTKKCVCIWCHADKYVEKYNIKGFYTGMFISEVNEAQLYGIKTTQDDIDYSNNLFAGVVYVFLNSKKLLTEVKSHYVDIDSPVINFNNQRLYYKTRFKNILKNLIP